MKEVTDPSILSQLDNTGGLREVTDPQLLAHLDYSTSHNTPSIGRTALDQSLQGVPLVGTFADEVAGTAGGWGAKLYDKMFQKHLFDDTNFSDVASEGRNSASQNIKDELQQHPAISIGSQLGSGLATGGAAARTKKGQILANSLRGGNLFTRATMGAAAGAASGAAYGAGAADSGQRTEGAEHGAKLGGGVGALAPIVGAAVNAVTPVVADAIKPIAQKAQEYGIPLNLSQITDSKIGKLITSAAGKIPFSGAKGFEDTQQKAFNSAISKTIGEDSNKITPEVIDSAFNNIGGKFDSALAGRKVSISDDHINQLIGLENEAQNSITNDHADLVRKNINRIFQDLSADGTVPGEKLGSLRSDLSKIARNTDNDASPFIGKLANIVADISVDGAPDAAKILNVARSQYKNLMTILPLASKNPHGDIPASQLLNNVRNNFNDFARGGGGQLGDLARIGRVFLRESIPDSGTAQRAMVYKTIEALGTAGAGAAAGGLPGAVAAVAAPVATARGINAINTNQRLVNGAVGRTAKPSSTPLINKAAIYAAQLNNQ